MLAKKRINFVLFFLLCLGGTVVLIVSMSIKQRFNQDSNQPEKSFLEMQDHFSDRERRVITIAGVPLEVEVVASAESTAQGLSGRESIGADGMLFVFPDSQVRRFWMPDMQFDIDILWIQDKTVVDISEQVPKPLPEQKVLPTYSPTQPVNRVLELPAGKASELGIGIGASVEY